MAGVGSQLVCGAGSRITAAGGLRGWMKRREEAKLFLNLRLECYLRQSASQAKTLVNPLSIAAVFTPRP